ncbi:MAG TPA: hypothetical protein VKU41_03810 [Polyangiaceae bacterium]|nr:hypothetical protein [Polyangiaceae bacterium]
MALLSDKTLVKRFLELIEDGSPDQIQRCAYKLSADRVFAAATATNSASAALGQVPYRIEPGALVWVRTKEIVKVPDDLCGIWCPTNYYAQRGLMLINASIVEPGYRGPLTGALVNFGRTARVITSSQPFARIMYVTLDQCVGARLNLNRERAVYDAELLQTLEDAPSTFLNLGSLHDEVIDKLRARLQIDVEEKAAKAAEKIDSTVAKAMDEVSSKVTKPINRGLVFFATVAALVLALKESGLGAWVATFFQPTDLKAEVDKAVNESLGKRADLAAIGLADFDALRKELRDLSARIPAGVSSVTGAPSASGAPASSGKPAPPPK